MTRKQVSNMAKYKGLSCSFCGKDPCTCVVPDEKLDLSFGTEDVGYEASVTMLSNAERNGYQTNLSDDGTRLQIKGVSKRDLPGNVDYLKSTFGIKVRFK